ncbi:MAG: DUF3667 domain-containing protein [Bacteroidetes bacterium]|nr:DUF3667 domain-containing protein [Bacteroidota bacterium]
MTITCKNCGHHFEGKFCSNCGQASNTQRLDFHFLGKHVLKQLLTVFDKGILYTSGQLITRPGNSIREYIDGKRVRHYAPLALLVTLAALYGVLYHFFHIVPFNEITPSPAEYKNVDAGMINDWLATHYSLATCLLLPVYTLGSFIAFRKQGYNFAEHLVLNAYLSSQRLLFRIATFPIFLVFNGTTFIRTLIWLYILSDVILLSWGYCQFFNRLKPAKALLLSLLSYLIFFSSMLILLEITLIVISRFLE